VSSSGTPAVTPHDLIKEKDVIITLQKDKGKHAVFNSFKIKDFTTKGDNYACIVTSVKVSFTLNGVKEETSYVVKLNPCRGKQGFGALTEYMFSKESEFYETILPALNDELEKMDEPSLRLPKHLLSVRVLDEEVIYLEDMRRKDFRMTDRKKGLDKRHTELILIELGRLHAVSTLYIEKLEAKGVDVSKLEVFKDAFQTMMSKSPEMDMTTMFSQYIDKTLQITDQCKGYEYVSQYLTKLKTNFEELFANFFVTDSKFKVIGHGDCWNNNFLFK